MPPWKSLPPDFTIASICTPRTGTSTVLPMAPTRALRSWCNPNSCPSVAAERSEGQHALERGPLLAVLTVGVERWNGREVVAADVQVARTPGACAISDSRPLRVVGINSSVSLVSCVVVLVDVTSTTGD